MVWLRKFIGGGKIILLLIAVMVLVFAIGHIGDVGDVPAFLKRTWLLWLVVRWSMYIAGGWFLWQLGKTSAMNADAEAQQQYRKLVLAAIVGATCIETVVFYRLWGG